MLILSGYAAQPYSQTPRFLALSSLSTLLWITMTGTVYGLVRIYTDSTLAAAFMHGCYNLTLFLWQGA
jgi:membrane protease YdiL (CAAX protease family)